MVNLFLTKKCNLKCSYCFADEFVNKGCEEFSLENIKKAIDFIKTDGTSRIGLIGGEPTLYTYFSKVLDMLNDDENIDSISIFTNGLEIDKYFDQIKAEKFSLLVNCNSPKNIGCKYHKLEENIAKLAELKGEKCILGINLYSKDMDYSYIFELLNKTNNKILRYSIAIPNVIKEKTENILDACNMMKPLLLAFYNDCLKNKIIPFSDCNCLPICIYTREDMKILIELDNMAKKQGKFNSPIRSCITCTPVIDILPDLNAVRCFGLSKYMKVDISTYKTVKNLTAYFSNTIDIYAKLSFVSKKCKNCKMRLIDKCGICYTYKIKQIEKLKNII